VLDQRFYPGRLSEVWAIYEDALRIVSWAYGVRVHSFVLMTNHYHLLCSTPEGNIDQAICFLQSHVSREIAKREGSAAFCFDTRYRWTLIRTEAHVRHAYRYVYQNPLRAGLAANCEDYEYSSLRGLVGLSRLGVPLWDLREAFGFNVNSSREFLDWLAQLPSPETQEACRRALHKREYGYAQRVAEHVEKELGAF
jgi:REP element-mobilizing transposase RayT